MSLTQGWQKAQSQWQRGETDYDVIIIGGGINGAAVAWLSANQGLNTLLLEAQDFASGTSSRSSKMIHGGLRYLAKGDWRLTREAAKARDRLLSQAENVVKPLPFWYLHRPNESPRPWMMKVALGIYRAFASGAKPSFISADELTQRLPSYQLGPQDGASSYFDAISDDCTLVNWLLGQACDKGLALKGYQPVQRLISDDNGVSGVEISTDTEALTLTSKVVVNCAGAWCGELTALPLGQKMRPLRGSHLVLPMSKYPAPAAITFGHPQDGRPVYLYPWLGTAVMGTTDLDHETKLTQEVAMSEEEYRYLLTALKCLDPNANEQDIISSWSGVRPVIEAESSSKDPSSASREHLIWCRPGLVNLTGGKLTTFLETGQEIMEQVAKQLAITLGSPQLPPPSPRHPLSERSDPSAGSGSIIDTVHFWNEITEHLIHGAITNLDDLLLRRTRIGLLVGKPLERIKDQLAPLCQQHLGWESAQFEQQWLRYWKIWHRYYSPAPFKS